MGGKRLKFPARQKYVSPENRLGKFEEDKETPKDPAEVQKLIEMLENMKRKSKK